MPPMALFWLSFGPALAAAVVALLGDGARRTHPSSASLAAAALLASGGVVALVGGWVTSPVPLFGAFVVGSGRSPVAGTVLVLAAAVIAGSHGTRFGRSGQSAALVSLSALGSSLAVVSADLLVTLLSLETAAVCGYALVASERSRRARESAFKYFIQGAVASALMTMGIVAIIGATGGDTAYGGAARLADTAGGTGLAVLAAVLLVAAALVFKLGGAPFHAWAPDVYENAPAQAAAVLAGPVKLAVAATTGSVLAALVRQGVDAFAGASVAGDLVVVLAGLAGLSVLVGSLTALSQSSLRRMLGYAGVAQAGYALIAIAAFNPSAAIIHMVLYAVASTGVFLAASAFMVLAPGWDGTVGGLSGLGRRHPVLGASITVSLASLAGLPPLGGFWGKFQVFSAPIVNAFSGAAGSSPAVSRMYAGLAIVGLVGSVVSVAYYGAVVRALFFGEASELRGRDAADGENARAAVAVAVVVSALLLAAGIVPAVIGPAGLLDGFLLAL